MTFKYYCVLVLMCLCAITHAQPPNISYTYEYPYTDGIPFFRYTERREALRNAHSDQSLILSLSADTRNRQNDVNHPYRQSSNFLYLTGIPYPQTALILAPGGIMHEGKLSKEFLFINPRTTSKEAWEGALMGIEEARMLGIETILPYSSLQAFVMEHLNGKDTLYFT
ncbi:MAG: aminopeptidase P N-terminal domain-containing protein, partial [Ignavibacteria bacterium]